MTFHYVGGDTGRCAADGINDGRLCAIVDAHGNAITLTYDTAGATIVAPTGATTTLSFDTLGYTERIVNSHGEAFEFDYKVAPDGTSTGLMESFMHPNGETKGYRFNDNGRLTDAIAEDGTAREFEQWVYAIPYGDERRIGVRRSRSDKPDGADADVRREYLSSGTSFEFDVSGLRNIDTGLLQRRDISRWLSDRDRPRSPSLKIPRGLPPW